MSIEPGNTKIGFIGTGVMGASMASHLMDAGYAMSVFNRTKSKADALVARGAIWCDSPGEVAAKSDVVITIVGYPADVEATYLGDDGIVAMARDGAYLIDMTTSSPTLAHRIAEAGAAKGLKCIDAPVSGGDKGAQAATLSIMVGGDAAAVEAARPVLDVMGKNIVYQGPVGSGQHTKMCNQIAVGGAIVSLCEALAYAKRAGLDQTTVLSSISTGAAGSWQMSNLGPRIIAGDYAAGFYVKHFIKDMKIAIESAEEMGLDLPGLAAAKGLYEKLAAAGGEDDGTQALIKLWS